MEKILNEHFKCSVVIIEQRDKSGLTVPNTDLSHNIEYVYFNIPGQFGSYIINSTTLSQFSLRTVSNYVNINIMFKKCEKLSKLEEIIKYNFDTQMDCNNIIINTQYRIWLSILQICIYDDESKSHIFECDIDSVTIYDILDHPVLQPFRINHSKPINSIMFE